MEIPEILAGLREIGDSFPREAMEAAIERREEITPHLLSVLEDTLSRADELSKDPAYAAHLFAFCLLAQFGEARAYPLAIRYARQDPERIEDVLGDFTTESLPRILVSVFDGDAQPIKDLIEDRKADEFARGSGISALAGLVISGRLERDDVIAYFKSLFEGGLEREPSMVWGSLVENSVNLHPAELMSQIRMAFDANLVTEDYITRREVEDDLAKPVELRLAETRRTCAPAPVQSAIGAMEWWGCFQPDTEFSRPSLSDDLEALLAQKLISDGWDDDEEIGGPGGHEPLIRDTPRIGRNEPCPCGSGKKYKKCCGKA
jgi:hypothetical protein